MKILFLTKYTSLGASSRYCYYNYFPIFREQGVSCTVSPFFADEYVESINQNKPNGVFKIFGYYWCRIKVLLGVQKYDLIVIEYELFPYFPSFFERIIKYFGIKYIVGYDDAVFHNYDLSQNLLVKLLLKNKIKSVIKNAKGVMTGSPYLTNYAQRFNNTVREIPTSIDERKYAKGINCKSDSNFVIGWIGSKSTSKYILEIIPSLRKFSQNYSCEIRLIGFNKDLRKYLDDISIKFVDWEENTEVEEISKISVGIMPLLNDQWSRGKCGFKLIQYMACAKPTISTPLEANVKINRNGKNLHADSKEEWYNALEEIYLNQERFQKVGFENNLIVSECYSIQANYRNYLDLFRLSIL